MTELTSSPSPENTADFRFNPLDLEFKAQPYPTYDYLRSHDPIHWGFLGAWTLTRYEDVQLILRHNHCHSLPIPQNIANKGLYLQKKNQNLEHLVQVSQVHS